MSNLSAVVRKSLTEKLAQNVPMVEIQEILMNEKLLTFQEAMKEEKAIAFLVSKNLLADPATIEKAVIEQVKNIKVFPSSFFESLMLARKINASVKGSIESNVFDILKSNWGDSKFPRTMSELWSTEDNWGIVLNILAEKPESTVSEFFKAKKDLKVVGNHHLDIYKFTKFYQKLFDEIGEAKFRKLLTS